MIRSRIAFVALLGLFALPAISSAKDPKLAEYTSDEGRYKAMVPAKFVAEKPKVLAYGPNENQVVKMTTEKCDCPNSGGVYSVTFADYPPQFKDVSPKTILDGVRDGMVGQPGLEGKLEYEKDVTIGQGLDKLTYREIKIKAGSKVVRARLYLIETRLYQVMVTGTEKNTNAAIAEEFLNSFKVVK